MVLSISGAAYASSEDEQWPIPNESAFGHHSVLIQDNDSNGTSFSLLTMTDGINNWLCSSISDPKCAKATGGYYRAMLPMCSSETDKDCIVSVEAINPSGEVLRGNFVEYIYGNSHPTEFKGDGLYTPMHASDPSIWRISGAEHGYGNEYGVVVGLTNGIQVGSPRFEDTGFFMNIYPISRMKTEFSVPDMNGYSNYPKCIESEDSKGVKFLGCGGGAQEFGKYRCALKMISDATCLLQHAFPTDFRFRITTRLAHEPAGMFHGRLVDPSISIAQEDKATRVSVEAGSVRVPILYSGDDYNKLPVELQKYWDQCIGSGTCRGSSRQAQGNDWADPLHRNIQDYAQPYGERSLKLIETFSKSTKETSVAAPSSWNIRTLGADQMRSATACFKSGKGFVGVVSTNSTTYSEGPPSFAGGELNYKVASLHFLSKGEVFKGSYNLILRSDVARCLYRFSNAPISATISILSADGKSQVATTVVNEKNNWLYLSANGFTFSSPTVRVKLTQESSKVSSDATKSEVLALPKSRSITCTKGKTKKRVTAVNPKCPSGYKKVA